jgi:hypothetical protein
LKEKEMNRYYVHLLCGICLLPASLLADINTDLVAHWNLSDGEGTVAKDRVAGNHGTLMGDAAWTDGQIGGAVLLDGDGDYIDCGSADVYNLPNAVTLAAWVLPTTDITLPDWSGIIMRGGPNIDTYALYYNLASQQVGFKTTGTGSAWMAGPGPLLFNGEWHHTAAVYDGSTKTIYLDAESTVTLADSGAIESSDGRVLLGAGRDFDPPTHYLAGKIDDARIYGRALTVQDLMELMTVQDVPPGAAAAPTPANQADDVPLPVTLSWEPGAYAATHNVYLGTEFDDVNSANTGNPLGVLVSEGQAGTTFAPDQLAFGQTYFWRVDEVNSAPDFAVYKSDIWSFDTEPVSYPIPRDAVTATASSTAAPQDPMHTVDGSGLNENGAHGTDTAGMWISLDSDVTPWIQFDFTRIYKLDKVHVWNHNTQTEGILGFGIKEALIETSQDGETWAELATVELAQATGKADYTGTDVTLGGTMAQSIRITALSNHSLLGLPQKGLAEVRFYAIPVQAREPQPADGSTSNGVDVILDWRSGREAVEHEVLFGTDEQAVIDGSAAVATVSESSYDPGALVLGTTYFWKINEINDLGTPPVYEGDLWTFQTPNHLMIDDFEIYQAKEGLRIWETWLDGFDNQAENGAVVGNGDNAERGVVFEGLQSMPIAFNNTLAPRSEVIRFFDTAVDLTHGDSVNLKLQVIGDTNNGAASMYLILADTAGKEVTIDHPDPAATLIADWDEWTIPLSDLGPIDPAKLDSITIGIGTTGVQGMVYVDAIRTHRD